MPFDSAHAMPFGETMHLLIRYRYRWLVPTLVCTAIALIYALTMTRYWEAKQTLVVRQEASNTEANQPGKFANSDEIRTLQETILELAKSRQVVIDTLKEVNGNRTPTDKEVEQFRKHQEVLPPNGSEFGKTEVFYMTVQDPYKERAIRLLNALCHQLELRLGQLRDQQAQSLIAELEKQVALSTSTHAKETQRLVQFEGQLGADLGELRTLHSAFSGQSDLRQQLVQLEGENRQLTTRLHETEQLLAMLTEAEQKPGQIVAMPSSLLESQLALRRLKDGLVDAQLRTAQLSGSRSVNHPYVKSALLAEESIRQDLHDELQTAVQAAKADLKLARERYQVNRRLLQNVEQRLGRLAEHRAAYSNRIAAVSSSRAVLERARGRLNEIRATQAAVHSSSLVSRIDQPETGLHPIGPSRAMVVLTGMVGGLMIGLGYFFLSMGPASPQFTTVQDSRLTATAYEPQPELQTSTRSAAMASTPFSASTVSSVTVGLPLSDAMGTMPEQTMAT